MLSVALDGSATQAAMSVYVDGKLRSSVECSGTLALTGGTLYLGKDFNGAIDEVRLYDTSLSLEELARIYEFDSAFLKEGPTLKLDFEGEFPDYSGMAAFTGIGPTGAGAEPGSDSTIMECAGIHGKGVFLGPEDHLITEKVKDPFCPSAGGVLPVSVFDRGCGGAPCS